jgi:hypothetical protein
LWLFLLQVVESFAAVFADLSADSLQPISVTKQLKSRTADTTWDVSQKNAFEPPQETRRK